MCGFGIEVLVEVLMNNRKPKTGLPSFKKKKNECGATKTFRHFHFSLYNMKTRQIHQVDLGNQYCQGSQRRAIRYYLLCALLGLGFSTCSEKAHSLQPLKAERQLERAVPKERSHHCLELKWLFGPLCPMQSDFAD